MKPITPERRAEIQRLNDGSSYPHPNAIALAVDELLDAEEYWKMAVARARHVSEGPYDDDLRAHPLYCAFCGQLPLLAPDEHKPDCPWLLATASTP